MKKILMIASAAAMAMTMPSLAQAQGKGKGASTKAQQSQSVKRNAKSNGQVRTDVRARTDARANARAKSRTGTSVNRLVDRNGDGVVNSLDRFTDRNRDGIDDRANNRYGGNVCPPGLAKKAPACVPPGQAKRMFNQGQRIPVGYNWYTDLNRIPNYQTAIPEAYRTDNYQYIYRDNQVYVVDRNTRLVTTIINLLGL
jgi:hypothetical protein